MSNECGRNMTRMVEKIGEHIVRELSNKYNFSAEEAMKYLDLTSKRETKKKQSGVAIPFCGKINEDNCNAIRLNHGLYTQCTNSKCKLNNGHSVCETCDKQISKNSNNLPTYGYISERLEKGSKYRDPKGKEPLNYGNVMEKLKITRNEAEREAANQGVTISEYQFEVKKAQRGRPKKDTTATDTSGSEEEMPKSEKKRGRPKKEKEIVSTTGDEMIKELMKSVNTKDDEKEDEKEETKDDEKEETKEDDDEESTEVEKFTFNGKEYLKSNDNTVYDVDSWEEIGMWNSETNKIDVVESSDED